jgi:hypothetical protein
MVLSHLHEFHFVLDRGMKNDLMDLELYKKTVNLSGVIEGILSLIGPLIKREHKWGKQRESRYLPVCDDPDEIREDVHAYLPRELYRELKLMHADLNYYSIGQMVRDFLRFFLDKVKEYGEKIFDELQKLFKRWEKENRKHRLTPRMIIRQLWRIIRHLPEQSGLINLYYSDFSPCWMFRL